MKTLKRTAVAFAVGLVVTAVPFVVSSTKLAEFFQWPALLVDRHLNNWVPLNPGKRVITLLVINVGAWALLLVLLLSSYRAVRRKRTF